MMKRLTAAAVAATLGFSALGYAPVAKADEPYWQCVTFARMFSGINIFGDAWTWWRQAAANFRTGKAPETGSVLVFRPEGRMSRGHVAVVSKIVSEREILVDQANWERNRITQDTLVIDISAQNDWSKVRVENSAGSMGAPYPVFGFIYR